MNRVQPGSVGTALVLLDGTIVACDEAYADLVGTTPEDLVGRSVADYADLASGYSPAFMINLLLRTRQPLLTTRDYLRRDGTKMLCEVQLCLLKNAAGEPDRIFVVAQPAPENVARPPRSIDRSATNA